MMLDQALDAFCTHQRAQGRSEKTVAIYAHDLQRVFTRLDAMPVATITARLAGATSSSLSLVL